MNISKNIKKKFLSKEIMISLIVIFFVFISDRVTKIAIINHQLNNQSIFVNDYLNLELFNFRGRDREFPR